MNLYTHQKQAADFITSHEGSALFADMGTGKTVMAMEAFNRLRSREELKLLVICPLSLIEGAWIPDIKRFYPHLKTCNLRNDTIADQDVFLINYESFIRQDISLPSSIMCVADESSRMKNHTTQTTKRLLALADRFKYRLIMTATPAPNCMTEYWAQIEFVQPGLLFNKFSRFRNHFFHYARNGQVLPRGAIVSKASAREYFSKGFKLDITDSNKEAILKRIEPFTFRCRKEDCLDLPDTVDQVRYVEMTPAQKTAYRDMYRHCIAEIEREFVPAPHLLTKIMKLRQITSGFCIIEGKPVFFAGGNTRIKELENVVDEMGNRQMIIWATFHAEIEMIARMLPGSVCLYGKTTDKQENIDDFKNGKAQFLIAHPASAGHGLTFTNCDTQYFFSLDYSFERYFQAKGRTHRIGQTNKCTYIHALAKDTIDEDIYNVLQAKGTQQDLIDAVFGKRIKA